MSDSPSSDSPVKVTVRDNGPIRIEGNFVLCDGQGNQYDLNGRTAISLCRCGQSANLPICDGAHGRCGFQSTVVAQVLPPPKK